MAETIMNAKGVDVSKWNGVVDWYAVKDEGISFAITKSTQGTKAVDDFFPDNWVRMKDAGLLRGAYHVFQPEEDPEKQARFHISTIGSLAEDDLPPVLDLEESMTKESEPKDWIKAVRTWLEVVEQDMVVKDGKPTRDVWVTPGTGRVDFPKVLKTLRKGGFTGGHLVIECVARGDGDLPTILGEAKKARKFLEDVVDQVVS